MSVYRAARSTTINDVDVTYYKCLRGSHSLEGYHKSLPNMIPGLPDKRHCAVERGQELGCSVRWQRTAPQGILRTADRTPQHPVSAAVQRNRGGEFTSPCRRELEYLFSQSTGRIGATDTIKDDKAYHSDVEI
ncbi:uncharacterized protein LOC108442837 isoform X1 [Tachysurus ichikawai]